jgi:hypothetical protein
MKKLIISTLWIFVLASSFTAAYAQPCDSLDSLEWITGEWIAEHGDVITREKWVKVSDRSFEGVGGITRKTSGETSGETLRLVEMSDEIFFIAKVAQNPLPVAFKLTHCPAGVAVFENAAHDFPKKLEYRLESEASLVVTVSDGADKGFQLHFSRAEAP